MKNARAGEGQFFEHLIKVLVLAGILELVLKLFWRIGIYMPKEGAIAKIYFALTPLQGVLFNFASLLSFIALAAVLYFASKGKLWEGRFNATIVASVSILLVLSAASIFLKPGNFLALFYILISSLAVALVAGYGVAKSGKSTEKIALALIALAYLCYRYYVAANVVNNIVSSASEPFLAIQILALGELLAALSAFGLFAAYSGAPFKNIATEKIPTIAASLAALLLAAASIASPAMTSVFAIWMLGFSMQFPIIIYVLAAWFFFFTLVSCLRSKEKRYLAYALLIIFTAGYTHKLTYQHLLGVLAVVLFTQGRRLQE